MTAAFFNGNEVVGIASVVPVLHGRRDFVVRLGEDAFEPDKSGVVAKGAKGKNMSHAGSRNVKCQLRSLPVYAKCGEIRKTGNAGTPEMRAVAKAMTERTERFPSASFTNLYTILKVRS